MSARTSTFVATLVGLLLAGSLAAQSVTPPPRVGEPPPLAAPALPPGWARLQVPLKPFELTDADGKTWRLTDLKGRKVLLVVWATWCGFCRQELPLVEELKKRLAGREDVQVLTLNIDQQPSQVEPFLVSSGYTFPSLFAADWFFSLGTDGSIPRNWIVDETGVVRLEQRGFAVQRASAWVDEVTRLVETLPPAR